jgi:hypothetical protein
MLWGDCRNPSEGSAFEPLISNGRGARVLWGDCRNPSEGPAFEPLISRRARGPLPSPRRILSTTPPFPVPIAREREREEEGKEMNLNKVAHLFRRGRHGGGETTPASPARGVACSAKELMQWDGRFAWHPLHVRAVRGTERSFYLRVLNFAASSGEVLNGSRPGLYMLGRGAGSGSSLCHLRLPSALVFAT